MLEDAHRAAKHSKAVASLLALMEDNRHRAEEDPFGNPVLVTARSILRQIERGEISEADINQVITELRDEAFQDRAQRIALYVGGTDPEASEASYARIAEKLASEAAPGSFESNREEFERTRFVAVFTAHPTFSAPAPVLAALAETASGHDPKITFASHRSSTPTLEQEFTQAIAAIRNGRDAIDRLNTALLSSARRAWPQDWTALVPQAVALASWVGYDTDGRVDINWWDTLRLRMRMKKLQLERLEAQVGDIDAASDLADRIERAIGCVDRQIAAVPTKGDPDSVAEFAAELIEHRDDALVTIEPLMELFEKAIAKAAPDDQLKLTVARAGLASHGMSFAHSHVRLNAAQVHNAVRLRLGLQDPPADPFRRRVLLGAINAALDKVEPIPVDFGSILAEQASATRLMMTVAQIAKHIDGNAPVRFLIAETESGYTLLSVLWLAKLFGVEKHVEISPLFETAEALEQGSRAIEEALRSPHYRAYLKQTGKLAIEFGYSDSGRYVGQLAATFLIERLRVKLADLMQKYGLADDVELILFDTHGESIGRGAHPGSLTDRLKYLSPSASRAMFARNGINQRDESSFQGGDGYLLFGTPEIAQASIARIAEHAFDELPTSGDPIYEEADFAADFFATIGATMHELVEDPGYASLLGAFGPALLDPTGSRPSIRQSDGGGGPSVIKHPRELRAILNNAILQQLGWCANTLQGIGAAAARQPELFLELRDKSPRFRRALEFASHALAHSDIDVLRATTALLDPGSWLDRAAHVEPARARQLVGVARSLNRLNLWGPIQSMFHRIQTDYVLLRAAWPKAPQMQTREMLLHAIRIALIQRIWIMATAIPDFSPRHGVTRQALEMRLLQLDVPSTLELMDEVFPNEADPTAGRDFGEPHGPRSAVSYAKEHEQIFDPIGRLFAQVREIATAITHEVGAFG
jgi:phosphoenolpyruvate carboxylase